MTRTMRGCWLAFWIAVVAAGFNLWELLHGYILASVGLTVCVTCVGINSFVLRQLRKLGD